jgi:tetratricopeptide (TPR) repeat protein
MKIRLRFWVPAAAALIFQLILSVPLCSAAAEASPTVASPSGGRLDETNSQELLRAYVQLQEQLHSAQLAIEQNRKEAKEAAAQNIETLSSRLAGIEQALAAQRAKELEAMQSSNRVMLIVAGSFAAVGFIAMLLMAYFQWRTIHGLAELSTGFPSQRALGPAPAFAALGPGGTQFLAPGSAQQSSQKLLGALELLEKRLYELEHFNRPPLQDDSLPRNGATTSLGQVSEETGKPADGAGSAKDQSRETQIRRLLTKGQSLLDNNEPTAALACFDETLQLSPNDPEALVKKGTALERLQRVEDALACYDRAIAADDSTTIAYLHKGGIYNRMERFSEALACYEQALRTHEKRGS